MRRLLLVLGFLVGLYLVIRAVAELFVIDMSDPATYRLDWGGPSLAGVLIVHSGPGVVAAVLMVWYLRRALTRRKRRSAGGAAAGGGDAAATGGAAG